MSKTEKPEHLHKWLTHVRWALNENRLHLCPLCLGALSVENHDGMTMVGCGPCGFAAEFSNGEVRRLAYRAAPISHVCPWCRMLQSALASVQDNRPPQPGDQALCITCGNWSMVDDDGTLRRPTPVEAEDIANDSVSRAVMSAWAQVVPRQSKGHA